MSVLHLSLEREGLAETIRYNEEIPVEGEQKITYHEYSFDPQVPMQARVAENGCEFDQYWPSDIKDVESATVFIHTVPEGSDVQQTITDFAENYPDQVCFMRVLKRSTIYTSEILEQISNRKESLVLRPLVSLLIYFKTPTAAKNYLERTHNTIPNGCVEPFYCNFIYRVYLSIKEPMMVMEEKRDKFYLKDLNLILLPHCIKCLLRLDDIFTALVGIPYNSIKEDSSRAESRLACNTCKALAARAPKCFKCDKTNDIWVCMICGKIGCGRYEGGHSLSHYSESCHNFSICLKDKIIWSYYTDNFVHRVPEKILYRSNSSRSNAEELIDRERLNSQDDKNGAISRFDGNRSDNEDRLLESNVSAMLCEQLDLQRTHYENTIEMLKEKLAHELEEQSNNQVKGLREKKQELEKGLAEKKNVLNALRKSKISLESKLREVKKQYEEEMEVQKNLESHISFIDKEDDAQIESINKDIENQKKLLEGFQAKLSDLYKQLE